MDPHPQTPAHTDWRAWQPGVRVVVRRRIDDATHRYTDVLGDLLQVDPTGVTVATRRGDVRVPADTIALARIVPPAPGRRRARADGNGPAGLGR